MRLLPALALAVTASACSLDAESSEPAVPRLASGQLVPTRCVARAAGRSATVAFVANGAAWGLDPRTGRLTCLFAVRRAGPFAWGPRGDRALLARLEVKAVGGGPSRPATEAAPSASSWGRPIGKSIVFVGRGGKALLKAHPAGGGFVDVTPVRGATYEKVVYHPSGLAFAFTVHYQGREALWISSNVGTKPRQLVHGRFHTDFEAFAFRPDGWALYFAAQHAGGRVDIHVLELTGVTEAPVVWRGAPHEHVTEIVANHRSDLAFTAGRSCSTRRAVVVTRAQPQGADALPEADSSRAVGWLDDRHLLVAAGRCGTPLDLYSVAIPSLAARLLVRGVDAASVRRPERLPTPELPRAALESGSGFA
jgi:hypothetical protein